MAITQWDDVTLSYIPPSPEAVGLYVDGRYANWVQGTQAFPRAYHLSITVNGSRPARCSDCEYGDFSVDGAARWGRDQVHAGIKPVQYTSAAFVQELINALASYGVQRSQFYVWSSHIGRGQHICGPHTCGYPQADGTQWTYTALGRNLDESILGPDNWFSVSRPPVPNMHYDRYPTGPFKWGSVKLNERLAVETYDHLRVHPRPNKAKLDGLRKGPLLYLRKRVWYEAHYDQRGQKRAHPDWEFAYRGWRWQRLNERTKGERVTS